MWHNTDLSLCKALEIIHISHPCNTIGLHRCVTVIWLVGWLCFTSYRQRCHLEMALSLARDVKLVFNPVHTRRIEPRAVAWPSITLPLRHASSTSVIYRGCSDCHITLIYQCRKHYFSKFETINNRRIPFLFPTKNSINISVRILLVHCVPVCLSVDVWMSVCMVFIFGALLEFAVVNVLSTRHAESVKADAQLEGGDTEVRVYCR